MGLEVFRAEATHLPAVWCANDRQIETDSARVRLQLRVVRHRGHRQNR
jgi:hypothetical protein